VSAKLLKDIRARRCLACGRPGPSDCDHITTRGAGGKDTPSNCWPLCRTCHQERHRKGLGHMASKYAACYAFLISNGRTDVLERIERMKESVL
jgi:HNH endonuclease